MKPRVIALYLPQYHPTPNNDKWWGKGFTEWTNVGKAKPLFRGHLQPKVPADLGYYDLRLPEVREAQAELAREAGIEGFCYYHYWFGNGHEELDYPLKEVVRLGKPDFPFCLCWANESWHCKFWNRDGSIDKTILAEQTYPGDEDIEAHFYSLLETFKDPRYIKVDGRLFFMIYQPLEFSSVSHFMDRWNELAESNGIPKFFFVGHLYRSNQVSKENAQKIKSFGFDKVNVLEFFKATTPTTFSRIKKRILNRPFISNYEDLLDKMITSEYDEPWVIPTIIPNWDHTPRSGLGGQVVIGSTPDLFQKNIQKACKVIEGRDDDNIIILKSWNEWGEGNYMEPDLDMGKAYIHALAEVITESKESE